MASPSSEEIAFNFNWLTLPSESHGQKTVLQGLITFNPNVMTEPSPMVLSLLGLSAPLAPLRRHRLHSAARQVVPCIVKSMFPQTTTKLLRITRESAGCHNDSSSVSFRNRSPMNLSYR